MTEQPNPADFSVNDKPRVPVGGWAALKFKRMPDGRVVPR